MSESIQPETLRATPAPDFAQFTQAFLDTNADILIPRQYEAGLATDAPEVDYEASITTLAWGEDHTLIEPIYPRARSNQKYPDVVVLSFRQQAVGDNIVRLWRARDVRRHTQDELIILPGQTVIGIRTTLDAQGAVLSREQLADDAVNALATFTRELCEHPHTTAQLAARRGRRAQYQAQIDNIDALRQPTTSNKQLRAELVRQVAVQSNWNRLLFDGTAKVGDSPRGVGEAVLSLITDPATLANYMQQH